MGPTSHLAIGLQMLVLLIVLLAAGFVAFRMLRRPRRQGQTPHCARCDYNLTGLTSERCPECGTEMIAANVVYGELVRRPLSKVAAWICVAALGFVLAQWAWHYNWYQIRPTAWVISDVQSANPRLKSRAWRELDRRVRARSLSKSQESRLIDVCLTEQAAASPNSAMIDYLGASLLAGRMSENQKATFFKQIVQLKLTLRPTVIAGGSVPVEIDHKSRGPSQPPLWISLNEDGTARLDSRPTKQKRGSSGTSGMMGCGAGGSSRQSIQLSEWEGTVSPGKHGLAVTVQVDVYDGPQEQKNATRLHHAEISLESHFEVLAAEPTDYVKQIADPSLQPVLHDAIQPKDIKPASRDNAVSFVLECRNIPIAVAFDVLARVDGEERHIGSLDVAKGKDTNLHITTDDLPRRGPFDLILRSRKQVAMRTVDLFEIWQGELVYPGLRMGSPAQAAPATTTTIP